jgi:hypothetical protein
MAMATAASFRASSPVGAIHLSHRLFADAPEDLVHKLVIQIKADLPKSFD